MKYEYYTGGRIYIQKGSGDLFYCARVDGSLILYEIKNFVCFIDYDGKRIYGRSVHGSPVHRSLTHIGTLSLKNMGFHKGVTPYV